MKIDGRAIANEIKAEIIKKTKEMPEIPEIAAIILGDDPGARSYLKMLTKTCEATGFAYREEAFDRETSEAVILEMIHTLNQTDSVKGIIVQMPLPKHISEAKVIAAINPEKDVDGFHLDNAGSLLKGQDCLKPCTPQAVCEILKRHVGDLTGKNITVIGRSNIVGKPLALMLMAEDATVTICHSKTKDIAAHTLKADIVVVAVGKAQFLKKEMVKPSTIVIDVGTNMYNGKLVGDADYESLVDYVSAITPVPGGVGPVTNAMLLQNALHYSKV